jgi:hypothetical protein
MKKKALNVKVWVYTERQKKRQNEKEIKNEKSQRKAEKGLLAYNKKYATVLKVPQRVQQVGSVHKVNIYISITILTYSKL